MGFEGTCLSSISPFSPESPDFGQVAATHLQQLLRSTPLLACEVSAVRVGLGNLTFKDCQGLPLTPSSNQQSVTLQGKPKATKATDAVDQSPRCCPIGVKAGVGVVRSGQKTTAALRHFLHAIHACPTTSAAWLNAAEVRT